MISNQLSQTNVQGLSSSQLRSVCDPKTLEFKTTAELEPLVTLPGQQRALSALNFAASMKSPGYNLFVLGNRGVGKHAAVQSFLEDKCATEPAPDDWVYVFNFRSSHRPCALRLPPGTGSRFRDAMDGFINDLRASIPEIFESDEYRARLGDLDSDFEEEQEQTFQALSEKAKKEDVAILKTPLGFALAPMQDGTVTKPEIFNQLPEDERASIQKKIEALQQDLGSVLEKLPQLLKAHRERVEQLNAELTSRIFDASIKQMADEFADIEVVQTRLEQLRADLVKNADLFLSDHDDEQHSPMPKLREHPDKDPRFNRYRVNLIVNNDPDGDAKGAPLVEEDHPTLAKLIGRVEHRSLFGALVTDFTMIRAGALHRANGGYLIIDARKILTEPFAWEALKRTLRAKSIKIVSAADELGFASTVSLEPEPIPLDVKIVLIGERLLYYLLSAYDPEFAELFKIEADFADELPWSPESTLLYARLIATVCKRENLRPLQPSAVAAVIERAARQAEDAERLTLEVGFIADLLREADYWASESDHKQIASADVDKAVEQQIYRADRIRERSHEAIIRDTVLIDTDGEAIGQVNGLSVLSIGKTQFGKPSRITVNVRNGSGKLIDIERETKLGGPLHSKGVLILSGYLAARYALEAPMSLWASIVFEQSYGGVDGDSASSAELYALLSALAGVPIRQSLAVTGSVNQKGQIQPIGGVNEKIEGFYDICKQRGLTGGQGVVIPRANIKYLMLKRACVDAVEGGKFNVFAVDTVNEGLELLTGLPAGERNGEGLFPEGTVNSLVEEKLRKFADTRKRFGSNYDRDDEPADETFEVTT